MSVLKTTSGSGNWIRMISSFSELDLVKLFRGDHREVIDHGQVVLHGTFGCHWGHPGHPASENGLYVTYDPAHKARKENGMKNDTAAENRTTRRILRTAATRNLNLRRRRR